MYNNIFIGIFLNFVMAFPTLSIGSEKTELIQNDIKSSVNLYTLFSQPQAQKTMLSLLKDSKDKVYYQQLFLNLNSAKGTAIINGPMLTFYDKNLGFVQMSVIKPDSKFWINGKIISISEEKTSLVDIGDEIVQKLTQNKASLFEFILEKAHAANPRVIPIQLFLAYGRSPNPRSYDRANLEVQTADQFIMTSLAGRYFQGLEPNIQCNSSSVVATDANGTFKMSKKKDQDFVTVTYKGDKNEYRVSIPYINNENRADTIKYICRDLPRDFFDNPTKEFSENTKEINAIQAKCKSRTEQILKQNSVNKIVDVNLGQSPKNPQISICRDDSIGCAPASTSELRLMASEQTNIGLWGYFTKFDKKKNEKVENDLSSKLKTPSCLSPNSAENLQKCDDYRDKLKKHTKNETQFLTSIQQDLLNSAIGLSITESCCGDHKCKSDLYEETKSTNTKPPKPGVFLQNNGQH